MEKPRITFAQFDEMRTRQPITGTLSHLIGRFISEMDGTPGTEPVKPLGETHRTLLQRLQREAIAQKQATALTKDDWRDHCKKRKNEDGVCAATVMHDVAACSGVLKYAGSAWDDCAEVSDASIAAAKPFLTKHNLIGKSASRDRRPTPEEIAALLDYFMRPEHPVGFKRHINMARMTLWQVYSGRRVGESCALLWTDWNPIDQTILVRKMKDPKRKNKQKWVALPPEASAMLYELAYEMDARPELRDGEPRIFPYRSKSVSAAYTNAKKPGEATPEGIHNLRLHDSRRETASALIEKGYTIRQVMMVTGHERETGAVNIYAKANPATFKDGPLAQREARV